MQGRQVIQLLDVPQHRTIQARRITKLLAAMNHAMHDRLGRQGPIESLILRQQFIDRGWQIRADVLDVNLVQAPATRRIDQGTFD